MADVKWICGKHAEADRAKVMSDSNIMLCNLNLKHIYTSKESKVVEKRMNR